MGAALVQGEPAVGNRALKTSLVYRGRLLSLYKIRLVDLLDIDTPVRHRLEGVCQFARGGIGIGEITSCSGVSCFGHRTQYGVELIRYSLDN